MTHFLYLCGFAGLVSVVFGAISAGTSRERLIYGLKTFAQFIVISLVIAWVLFFIP